MRYPTVRGFLRGRVNSLHHRGKVKAKLPMHVLYNRSILDAAKTLLKEGAKSVSVRLIHPTKGWRHTMVRP